MQAETWFLIVNIAVLPAWLLLLAVPGWKPATNVICPLIVPGSLATVYFVVFTWQLFVGLDGDFNSLTGVQQLFTNEWVALAGWIHYLCFDLFVGSWLVRDSRVQSISRWWVAPCLVLTFFAGPIGMLSYFVIRTISCSHFGIQTPATLDRG